MYLLVSQCWAEIGHLSEPPSPARLSTFPMKRGMLSGAVPPIRKALQRHAGPVPVVPAADDIELGSGGCRDKKSVIAADDAE